MPGTLRAEALPAVCQLLDAVKNSHRNLFAADRAFSVVFLRFPRREAEIAFPMTVQMIFSLFGKKFQSSRISLSRTVQSLIKSGIREFAVQKGSFPSKLGGGMGIGIGYQPVTVQCGKPPVHRWIGRKTGFQSVNMGC